ATTCLFCSAQAVQASAKARAPALEMTVISLVSARSFVACFAGAACCCACNGTCRDSISPVTVPEMTSILFISTLLKSHIICRRYRYIENPRRQNPFLLRLVQEQLLYP